MLPPIFSLLSTNAAVGALIGVGSACRCYPWGNAPPDVVSPYVTWYTVAGLPDNTLSDTPATDEFVGQIDIWGDTGASAVAAATAVRAAIETYGNVTQYNPSDRDPATGRYRMSFDAEFVVKR